MDPIETYEFMQWMYYCPLKFKQNWPFDQFWFAAEGYYRMCLYTDVLPIYDKFEQILEQITGFCKTERILWTQLYLYDASVLSDNHHEIK